MIKSVVAVVLILSVPWIGCVQAKPVRVAVAEVPRSPLLNCRAVVLKHDGFQFATMDDVSPTYGLSELSGRLQGWKDATLSPFIAVFAREHRLPQEILQDAIEAVRRAGFGEPVTVPTYVAPENDGQLEVLVGGFCAEEKFVGDQRYMQTQPGFIDHAFIDRLDFKCEELHPTTDELSVVARVCGFGYTSVDDALLYASDCAEMQSCAQGCSEWMKAMSDPGFEVPRNCEPFVRATQGLPEELMWTAAYAWIYQRMLCVLEAAQQDPLFGPKVQEYCSNTERLRDLRRQQRPGSKL